MNMSILFVSYVICTETNKYNLEPTGGSFQKMDVIIEHEIRQGYSFKKIIMTAGRTWGCQKQNHDMNT